jgi:hypothetical protein
MTRVSQPPEKSKKQEIAEVLGEAAVSVVPVVGGPIAAIWDDAIGAAYRKRRQVWEAELVDAVNDLIDRTEGLTLEGLATNHAFLDTVAHATVTAAWSGSQEKLEALRNAVLNSALPSDIDADQQAMFLRYIRDFTPSHLRLLRAITYQPHRTISELDLARSKEGGIDRKTFYYRLGADLRTESLINFSVRQTGVPEYLGMAMVTDTGKAFLSFITDPR